MQSHGSETASENQPGGLQIIASAHTEQLMQQVSQYLSTKLQRMLRVQELVSFGVPGGRSVARVFDLLVREEIDWRRVHLFLADERLVPLEHPESNYSLLHEHLVTPLLQCGQMSMNNVHPFVYDAHSTDLGVGRYEEIFATYGLCFDLLLLSVGEDGHVASLFPHHPALSVTRHGFLTIDDAPKPPPARMSASLPLLCASRAAALLVLGEAKRPALAAVRDSAVLIDGCPAKGVLSVADCALFTDLV